MRGAPSHPVIFFKKPPIKADALHGVPPLKNEAPHPPPPPIEKYSLLPENDS